LPTSPRRLFPLLVCCSILVPAGSARARTSADLVISSGVEGSSYAAVADRVRLLLTNEQHYSVETLPSLGSMENLARIADPKSPVGVGLTQADALSAYLRDHPEFADQFVVLADIGKECAFLVTARRSGIASVADLKTERGNRIAVGPAGSGAAVTYAYMTTLVPELGRTAAANVGVMEALAQLKSAGEYSNVEGALLVQRPRLVSPPLEIVLDDPEAFRIVPIRRGDLTSPKLPDGGPVYTFDRIAVRKLELETICTRGLLLASKTKVPGETREQLAQLLLQSMNYIAPGQ
jgi:hypothetical protein